MQTRYFKEYSHVLGRDMECKVYGHAGRPVLFIPCQDGRFFDFENFHMTDVFSEWIEEGKCIVFSIDTIDAETWSDKQGDPYQRIRLHGHVHLGLCRKHLSEITHESELKVAALRGVDNEITVEIGKSTV